MALATTCPQCKTTFRLVPDQLKLRRGLVRCGVCHHVFSGMETLRYLEGSGATPGTALKQDAVPDAAVPDAAVPDAAVPAVDLPQPDLPEVDLSEVAASDADVPDADVPDVGFPRAEPPESGHPQDGFADAGSTPPAPPVPTPSGPAPSEPVVAAFRTRQPFRAPPGDETRKLPSDSDDGARPDSESDADAFEREAPIPDSDEADAVDFFADERKARGFTSRGAAFGALAVLALLVLLVLQLLIGGRDWLASRVPLFEPALSALSAPFGLQVQAPRELAALTIEAFEMQPGGNDSVYLLSALLRNQAGHPVQWPALELSLLDPYGQVAVRKVLGPPDYLGQGLERRRTGVSARAEVPIRTAVEVRGFSPASYRVRLVTADFSDQRTGIR